MNEDDDENDEAVTRGRKRERQRERQSGEGRDGTGRAISRKTAKRDGFNDTKYKIVLTLDRLKAP